MSCPGEKGCCTSLRTYIFLPFLAVPQDPLLTSSEVTKFVSIGSALLIKGKAVMGEKSGAAKSGRGTQMPSQSSWVLMAAVVALLKGEQVQRAALAGHRGP